MIYFLIVFFTSHFLYFGIGRSFGKYIGGCLKFSIPENKPNDKFLLEDLLFWCLGLLLHLWLTYLLYRLGINLHLAFSSLLVLTTILHYVEHLETNRKLKNLYFRFVKDGIPISVIIYFLIITGVGLSIISEQNGLVTYWSNNFGDFPFHLGITTNFAFNPESLVDYQIYPNIPLSYYFFIDFWTACFYIEPDNWNLFSLIYLFQWISCWAIVFFTFSFFQSGVNSYLLLFGGGTFTVFFKQTIALVNEKDVLSQLSHNFLREGYPWSVFISCIWIPQRGAVLGLAILIVAISLWSSLKFRPQADRKFYEVLIGILLALTFMVHFYLALVGILTLSLSIIGRHCFLKTSKNELLDDGKFFILALLFTLPSIYLLHSKQGILKFVGFWMPWTSPQDLIQFDLGLIGAIEMWFINATVLLVFFALIFRKKYYFESLPLIVIFILFNLFQFSVWDWDTYKAFIGIFTVVVCIYTVNIRNTFWSYLLIIVAIMPGVLETAISLSIKKPYEIYSKTNLNQVRLLRERTDGGVVIGKPDHNSIITAAGRKIFLGYEGWLSSHSINYSERVTLNKELHNNFNCESFDSIENKPQYLYLSQGNLRNGNKPNLTPDSVMTGLYSLKSICK